MTMINRIDLEAALSKPNLLLIDDSKEDINLLTMWLYRDHQISVAADVENALSMLNEADIPKPDLILLNATSADIEIDQLSQQLNKDRMTKHAPVILIVHDNDKEEENFREDSNAVDYITKPFHPKQVLARVRTHVTLHKQNRQLLKRLKQHTKDLHNSKIQVIQHLHRAGKHKDNESHAHVIRMSLISKLLAEYTEQDQAWVERIFHATPMHDVGKIGVPDSILHKTENLTPDEVRIMQEHTLFGAQILESDNDPLLLMASVIALTHHEKWDGSGYPNGLQTDQIPLEGRIVALADALDTLMSPSHEEATWTEQHIVNYLMEQKGQHFDPNLTDIAIEQLPQIIEILELYPDHEDNNQQYSFFKSTH